MTALPGDGRTPARGQALLEFALVLPVFLTVLIGTVDLGRVVWANDSIANAAREAARYAAVHGGSKTNPCPAGPPVPHVTRIVTPSADCPDPSPSREGIRAVARQHVIAGGVGLLVQVCYGLGCAGDTDAPGATNGRSTPVTVTVSSQVPTLIPSLIGLGPIPISASSTMLVNH